MVKIAIDAMGGDFGATPIVEGTLLALREKRFKALLVGKSQVIEPLIPTSLKEHVEIIEAEEIFGMEDSAASALKREETSIYKAVELVKNSKADAIVSAGHSGATMGLATLKIGRISGVTRPAIAALLPNSKSSYTLVLDAGANTDCKPEQLFQFAAMGAVYAKDVLKIHHPKVGLLSNGEEASKGNETTKEAYKLLTKLDSFVGNVEGNNIFDSSVNVVVCDGFIGNIVLKTSEGVADSISKIIKHNIRKSPVAMAGSLLMKKVFKILKKQVDYAEYGGAPLIGINGSAIICHGKSNSKAIKNAIFQAINHANSNTNEDIAKEIVRYAI